MIILDTNIISEMMRPEPNENVIVWIDQQESTHLYLSTITIAEITYGLHALPKGRRRQTLETAFENAIKEGFSHRILPFDHIAAKDYGKLMAYRKQRGHPMSILDGQIAAITRCHQASLATRNSNDFSDCGIDLVNPFN